jgi:hypothetical protein
MKVGGILFLINRTDLPLAHHCFRDHPANQIMQHFYFPNLQEGLEVPAILGLTASPVTKAKAIISNLRLVA